MPPVSLDWRAPQTPITVISRMGKFTDFNFGRYINSLHASETSLKILEKRVHGRIQGLLNFLGTPYYLRNGWSYTVWTSNFVCTFTGSIGLSEQKSIKNIGKSSRGRSQGFSKIFRAVIYRLHRTVVFAIAQLSWYYYCCIIITIIIIMKTVWVVELARYRYIQGSSGEQWYWVMFQ